MENATKALLIAAAVLVAILIISLGLVIYNMASETIENAGDLSEFEIQQHNDKFYKYVGEGQTAANVNAMLKTVFNYNLVQENDNEKVTVSGSATITTGTSELPRVSTGDRYDVTATYTKGMISALTIQSAT